MNKNIKKHKWLVLFSLLLGVLYAIGSIMSSRILQKAIDTSLEGNLDGLKEVIFFTVFFLAAMALLTYVYGYINAKLKNKVLQDYRKDIYDGIMRMDYQEFNHSNTATYISSLTNDIKMVEENYLSALFLVIQYGFMFIATLLMLFYLNTIVAISMIISVLFMFIIPSLFGKNLQAKQELVSEKLLVFTAKVKDILSGFEVIKSFNVFGHFNSLFMKSNNQLTKYKLQTDNLLVINESVSGILGALCQFVVVFVSTYLIIKGDITAGTAIALIQLSGNFIMPVITILSNFPKIQGILPIIKKLDKITVVREVPLSCINDFYDNIEIKNLSFTYDGEKMILNKINQRFEKGKKYAILGKSGCGKTTLTKVMSGYYDTYDGMISYDAKDIHQYSLQSSANLISMIHQNVYMFDTDIEHNITLYDKYTQEKLNHALQNSGVSKFINEQTEGLKTYVGENGNKLSGGQKQRIAIARALIRNTSILVLDEGTSAIDKLTASEIENELLALKEFTLITITHNLDTDLLSKYDEIIYMEDGSIRESGSFGELMNKKGSFFSYFNQSTHDTSLSS